MCALEWVRGVRSSVRIDHTPHGRTRFTLSFVRVNVSISSLFPSLSTEWRRLYHTKVLADRYLLLKHTDSVQKGMDSVYIGRDRCYSVF